MIKHYLNFLFFISTFLSSCKTVPVSEKSIFTSDQIVSTQVTYGKVSIDNPLKIWESELSLTQGALGHIYDIFKDAAQRIAETDLTIKNTLKAKIYRPADKIKRPTVVVLHGGAFIKGSKDGEEIQKLCTIMAQHGMASIAIEYRMMNIFSCSFVKAGYCATQDTKAALRYFKAHADEYGLDMNNVFLLGISAGAVTALHTGFLDENESISNKEEKLSDMFGGLNESGNAYEQLPKINGIVNIGGGVFSTDILDNNIPVLNIHGRQDKIVSISCDVPFKPFLTKYNSLIREASSISGNKALNTKLRDALMTDLCGSEEIHRHLIQNNTYSEIKVYEDEGHSFTFSANGNLTKKGREEINLIIKFIIKHVK